MATVDHPDHAVVISVVYDGPPRAGKTTTVRALARSFGRDVYTPEESNGRTVHFDWLEHIGGRFEGAPIHCQIVSVPGQKRWTRRRAHFLDRADVVVFVGDTTAAAWPETVSRLADLRANLDARGGAPVGLVFQANKRDCADAVSFDEVRARAATARTAVVESTAADGTGVREAFVFAVRLALDRVRDEHQRGLPALGRGGFGDERGNELVEVLRRLGDGAGDGAIDGHCAEDVDSGGEAVGATAVTSVRAPSHDAPSGFIWPPIEGRILLREAAPPLGATVEVTPDGDCWVRAGRGDRAGDRGGEWIVHSAAAAVFDEADEARAVLVRWARQHAVAQLALSRGRCIVLSETGDGRLRLWQIVRRGPTLRELAIAADRAERMRADAAEACARVALAVPCTLDTVGAELDRPIYAGLMPLPARPEVG